MDASTANAYLDPALTDTAEHTLADRYAELESAYHKLLEEHIQERAELAEIRARTCATCKLWSGPIMGNLGACGRLSRYKSQRAALEADFHYCARWEARNATR